MANYKILLAGDTALIVEFGEQVDRRLNSRVLALAKALDERRLAGLIETVPTFRSLMVHYDPLVLSFEILTGCIDEAMRGLRTEEGAGHVWHLPACYDASLAPDLDHVMARTGLTAQQVVEHHSAVTYHVYMLGFLPGQAYLGDVPAALALPRHETPRLKIPAGSLAIAGTMTCIFPLETPCGWHLIGRSPVPLWQSQPGPSALLAPGDKVSFTPISLREYERMMSDVAAGTFQVQPDDDRMGVAA
jgi:inhibitor of KinA